eukprot:1261792-Rhodomonas_salina.1
MVASMAMSAAQYVPAAVASSVQYRVASAEKSCVMSLSWVSSSSRAKPVIHGTRQSDVHTVCTRQHACQTSTQPASPGKHSTPTAATHRKLGVGGIVRVRKRRGVEDAEVLAGVPRADE